MSFRVNDPCRFERYVSSRERERPERDLSRDLSDAGAMLDQPFGYQARVPYSKMAAVLLLFCYCANEPTKPYIRPRILFIFAHDKEAWSANFHKDKRIMN